MSDKRSLIITIIITLLTRVKPSAEAVINGCLGQETHLLYWPINGITVNWPVQKIPFISIVFSFSLELKWPQGKLKTMLMQNFGVTNKDYYGMLWYFL